MNEINMDAIRDLPGRLAQDLPRLAAEHDVPGVSVAILARGGLMEATCGVVNTRSGVATTPDTLFMIQSITKIITATLVLQLVDDNLAGLDDPIRTYLPTFRTADSYVSGTITVRHLLTHTGGFEGDLWAETTTGPDALSRFVDTLVPHAQQLSAPGEQLSYCNAGFGVLGRLVEVLRRTSYEKAVRRHLIDPLGIHELAFSADQALAFRTAIGHVRPDPGSPLRPLRNWAVMPPSNPAAGNQLAMSARSLLAVAQLHLDSGRTPDGAAILSPASIRLMREPQVEHPGSLAEAATSHGLGWWLMRDGLLEHGGGSTGTASMLRLAPDYGIAAVVLTNAESGEGLINDLLDPVFADLAGIDPARRLVLPAGDRVASFERYVGSYALRQSRIQVTQATDGRLWRTAVPQHEALEFADRAGISATSSRQELRPIGEDTFVLMDSAGLPARPVEFLGRDTRGRANFLFESGRAHPRSD